jgi:hypothetical protein
MDTNIEKANNEAVTGNIRCMANGAAIFFALVTVISLGYAIARDSGVIVPVNDKLSSDLTAEFFNAFHDTGIGYIRSGSGSIAHGGTVSVYGSYEGLQPQLPLAGFDYRAPAFTPHAHFIIHEKRIEVRYNPDTSIPYSQTLTELSSVLDFALSKYRAYLENKRSWQ